MFLAGASAGNATPGPDRVEIQMSLKPRVPARFDRRKRRVPSPVMVGARLSPGLSIVSSGRGSAKVFVTVDQLVTNVAQPPFRELVRYIVCSSAVRET